MTTSDSKSIVAVYLDQLHSKIPSAGSPVLVFRGLENNGWGLESTAYRRYANPPPHSDFIQYNCELIDSAKNANYHRKENNDLEDIELLAELRHYGAATALIDFTRDFLVALWFASREWKEKAIQEDGKEIEIQTDGKVIIANIGDSDVFLELTSKDKQSSLEEILNFKTREDRNTSKTARTDVDSSTSELSDQKKAKLWYWQPRFAINHRLSAQKGVFIFGKAAINTADIEYWQVIISQEHKEAIHRELSDCFGINEDSLFNDLPGFAMVNNIDHEIQSRSADDYYHDAVQYFQRGKFDQAILDIDKAIELDPSNADYHQSRSQSNRELKRHEDALRDITKAIELDPSKAAHHFIRGQVNHDLNRSMDALKDFNMSIRLVLDKAFFYYSRGEVNFELDKYEDALRDFTKAIELDPNNATFCYAYRGLVYRYFGKHEDALGDFNKAIELDPHYAYFYFLRGLVYRDLEKYENAVKDIDKAIKMEPDKAIHYYSRGEVYRDLERYDDALKDATKAIKLDPDRANYYSLRAQVNRDLGKHEDAQRDFDKAKQLELNSSEARPEGN